MRKARLSDFIKTKQIRFVSGRVEVTNTLEDIEIDFYELTKDKMIEIKEGLIDKLNDSYNEERFVYDIIPYVSNIEKDISYEDFLRLTHAPTLQFTYILDSLIDITNNVFELAKKTEDMNIKLNKIKENNPEMFIKQETTEEKIIRLTKELDVEKDIKKKRDLLKELTVLYEEIENGQQQ